MACMTPTHFYRRYLVDKLILAKLKKPIKFLEIGCGTGEFSSHLAFLGHSGRAIDISKDAIKITQKRLSGTNVDADIADLNEVTGKYEFVFCFEVIEHLKDDISAIKKINLLLSPGGRFIFSVPAHMRLWGRDDKWGGHYRRYEKESLSRLLLDSGFKINNFWDYGFPVFNMTRWIYNLVCSVGYKNTTQTKEVATLQTGMDKEGGSFIKFFKPLNILLPVFFWISNFFLESNLGSGYLIECKKAKII